MPTQSKDSVTDALGYEVGAFKANAPPDAEPNRGVIYARDIHASPARIHASTVPLLGVEGEVAFLLHPRPARPATAVFGAGGGVCGGGVCRDRGGASPLCGSGGSVVSGETG